MVVFCIVTSGKQAGRVPISGDSDREVEAKAAALSAYFGAPIYDPEGRWWVTSDGRHNELWARHED